MYRITVAKTRRIDTMLALRRNVSHYKPWAPNPHTLDLKRHKLPAPGSKFSYLGLKTTCEVGPIWPHFGALIGEATQFTYATKEFWAILGPERPQTILEGPNA